MDVSENTELIASGPGKKGLKRYYGEDLRCTTIKEKPSINLGNRTLQFVPVPMVHWPDSMVTYIPEEKLLLSNDAFGQHFATSNRFDDEVNQNVLLHEAKTYYANIVMHLWKPIGRALKALEEVEIEMIAPSHGVIWRSAPETIIEAYKKWVDGVSDPRVVIVYDTMWGSTEMVANALIDGITSEGVKVQLYNLSKTNKTEIITDVLDARVLLIGSPTLNYGLFPSVASFLAYLKGFKPRNKLGAFFGSYGWSGGAKREVEAELRAAGVELIQSDLDFNYRPDKSELEKAEQFGKNVARKIK
jgi:flavorubredoxin